MSVERVPVPSDKKAQPVAGPRSTSDGALTGSTLPEARIMSCGSPHVWIAALLDIYVMDSAASLAIAFLRGDYSPLPTRCQVAATFREVYRRHTPHLQLVVALGTIQLAILPWTSTTNSRHRELAPGERRSLSLTRRYLPRFLEIPR
jgi:hypothetical protein